MPVRALYRISELAVAAFLSPETGKELLVVFSVEVFGYGPDKKWKTPFHPLLQGQCNLAFCFQLQGHKLGISSVSSKYDRIESESRRRLILRQVTTKKPEPSMTRCRAFGLSVSGKASLCALFRNVCVS